MKENSIRRAGREGRAALGTGLKEFASRGVPWIIEAAGFDYCAIDHEHGAFDIETIANLASWFQATNISPIVRLHKSFAHLIPGILDQGIMGIQVSEVETAQEARAIVRLAKYPPIGNRGISGQGPTARLMCVVCTDPRAPGHGPPPGGAPKGKKTTCAPTPPIKPAPWANKTFILFRAIGSQEVWEKYEAIHTRNTKRYNSNHML